MKITIFLALALAAVYVAQAEPLHKEEAQGHTLEQEQDHGSTILEPTHQGLVKRAACEGRECAASCDVHQKLGFCRKERCQCFEK